jgi:formamidopyrimidine-DNA glycosylase
MPELPEVETVKNGIQDAITNYQVANVVIRQHQLRWPIPKLLPEMLQNQQLLNITRRAKYLLLQFEEGTLMIHLGMSGKLRVLDQATYIIKHDHFDLVFSNNTILRYNDPRRFGCILWCEGDPHQHRLIKHLGPEPLSAKFNAAYLQKACNNKKTSIKQAIMDAKVVVGIGNIYASEALFLSGIHPATIANTLSYEDCKNVCRQSKVVLRRAIKAGGTTLQDFSKADGKPGYFQQKLNVYGRDGKGCHVCGAAIDKITQAGRSTYFCHQCQPIK